MANKRQKKKLAKQEVVRGQVFFAEMCLADPVDGSDLKTPKEWIPFIPGDSVIEGEDGRVFINDRPKDVVARFNKRNIETFIDVDHSLGEAVAWIDKLEVREDNSIWGHVRKWLDTGSELVSTEKYKYLSPTFYTEEVEQNKDKEVVVDSRGYPARRIVSIVNIALTNNPNFTMEAAAASQNLEQEQEETMDKEAIAKVLGLAASVSDDTIMEFVAGLVAQSKKTEKNEVDLQKYIPVADYQLQIKKLNEANEELKQLKAKLDDIQMNEYKKSVDQYVEEVCASRLIDPTSREVYRAFAMASQENLEKLQSMVKANADANTGNVVNLGLSGRRPKGVEVNSNDPQSQAKELAKTLGVSEESAMAAIERNSKNG